MQKEELIRLLGPKAREAFDGARRLACSNGGVLSALHLVVALLQDLPLGSEESSSECARLLVVALGSLSQLYPEPAQSILVPKETQGVIADANRLAQAVGAGLVMPAHLLRASLASDTVRGALGDCVQYEPALAEFELATTPAQSRTQRFEAAPAGSHEAPARPAAGSAARTLSGVLREYCSDLAEESRGASALPFIGREREVTAVLETLCRKLKSNPLLIGKPGVGKSALVAAVSARLCEGKVPARLKNKRVLEVSRLRLLADAKFAGDIEERLKNLLE